MRSTALSQDERGMALPTALFALVVIGALVAGIFFTARIEVRSGENTMSNARATEAAQAGLMMGYPNVLTIAGAITNGNQAGSARTQIGTTGSYYTDSVTRLNQYMYLLRSFGTYEVNGNVIAARTLAMLIKRYMPELNLQAGATVVGTPNIGGSAVIDGSDHTPPGWTNCGTPGSGVPGIRTNSTTANVQKASNIITDNPTEVTTGDTSVSNMSAVLDTMFYQLAAQANIVLNVADGATLSADPNPNTAGTCLKAQPTYQYNWGDPTRNSPAHACENYFPIVYVNPAMTGLNHGSVKLHMVGQGVLLINGDLEVNAGSNYTGLILIRGEFGKANGNVTLTGGVVSQNADLDAQGSNVTGNLTLNYSKCAVSTALNNLAVSSPATYRGFIQY